MHVANPHALGRLVIRYLAVGMLFAAVAPASAAEPLDDHALLGGLQRAFTRVADRVEPAVVTLYARKASPGTTASPNNGTPRDTSRPGNTARSEGEGSGVIVRADGWVLTNDHVVGGADRVTVKLHDGRQFDGRVRRDYRSDIAMVKIEATDLPAVAFGDSATVRVGQWAIAVGSPYRYEGSFSVGVISALDRRQQIADRSGEGPGRLYPRMFQTDAAINPGNSGGPLVNIDGELIGVNTAMETEGGGSLGIGFVIPINDVRAIIDQLMATGTVRWGYLGLDPTDVDPRLADVYHVREGALVRQEPAAGTPAATAGLHVEDVVTTFDGKPVAGEADLRLMTGQARPGATVKLGVVRAGKPLALEVRVAEAPDPLLLKRDAPARVAPELGLEVAAFAPREQAQADVQGVVIRFVDRAGCASGSELLTGDVILRLNDTPTPTVEAFQHAAAALRPGDVARIVWQGRRNGATVVRLTVVTMN